MLLEHAREVCWCIFRGFFGYRIVTSRRYPAGINVKWCQEVKVHKTCSYWYFRGRERWELCIIEKRRNSISKQECAYTDEYVSCMPPSRERWTHHSDSHMVTRSHFHTSGIDANLNHFSIIWEWFYMCPTCAGVSLVELPERFGTSLPSQHLEILIEPQGKPILKKITWRFSRAQEVCDDESEEQEEEDDGGEFLDEKWRAMQLASHDGKPLWRSWDQFLASKNVA